MRGGRSPPMLIIQLIVRLGLLMKLNVVVLLKLFIIRLMVPFFNLLNGVIRVTLLRSLLTPFVVLTFKNRK